MRLQHCDENDNPSDKIQWISGFSSDFAES